jgi:predicted PhzF superfamily epimerase YddE/YHI9
LHARGLAPLIGIDEDPFTGSMQAGLIHAAKQNDFIEFSQQKIIVEQGNFLGRPGFAEINHDMDTDELFVTASAVQVFSTKLEV